MNALIDDFICPDFDLSPKDENIEDFNKVINFNKDRLVSRWNKPTGISLFEKLKENNFSKSILGTLVGKYHGHFDLRGIKMTGLTLECVDLSDIDFFGSDFTKTTFNNCEFRNSWLSQSKITDTVFRYCTMKDVIIDDVDFNHNTIFYGINLNELNFNLATLLQRAAISQQRIQELERKSPKLAMFLRWTSDYGRSVGRWTCWFIGVLLFFAIIYTIFPNSIKNGSGFLDSLYFSLITFTTLGFGDILPADVFGKILVMLEVLLGYIMSGLLVAIIAKKVLGD